MNEKKKGKDIHAMGFFDLAKGLGMIFIVLGHSYNLVTLNDDFHQKYTAAAGSPIRPAGFFSGAGSVIGAAVVAMFFMISGYSFFKRKPKKCFSMQSKLLLKPYAVTGVFVVVSKLIISLLRRQSFIDHGAAFIPTFLFGTSLDKGGRIFGLPAESISILWFILALFEVWVTYNLIARIKDERIHHAVVLAVVIAGYIMGSMPVSWPFMLPSAMVSMGYFHIGHLCKKYKVFEQGIPRWLMILAGSAASFSLLFGYVNIAFNQFRIGLIDVVGTAACGFILMYIYVKRIGTIPDNAVTTWISAIGFASIWIVCLHGYEMCVMPWYRLTDALSANKFVAFIALAAARSIFIWAAYMVIMLIRKKTYRKKKVVLER